ncbi:MAG TPA: PIN domain-containing protein [Candidatus Nanoarchaeia archaeon]|nr:PIN domain-containing protein [Candidatus Nanoarchaeia archaeon]
MKSEKDSLRLIVDTNRIIAALIRYSISRRIITHLDAELYTIGVSEREIAGYKSLILKKAGLNEVELDVVFEKIRERMIILEDNLVLTMIKEAKEIMDKIDPDETAFIAAALAIKADIWSDDKHFQKQKNVKVWKTSDLMRVL